MLRLDRSMNLPEENLALDEALYLQHATRAEGGDAVEVLRFWESPCPFVVMGAAGKTHEEVDLEACRVAGVPVLRRPSGGGTVVQGPGCLNYALVLSLETRPELSNFTRAWDVILERTAAALGPDVRHVGISDLAIGERKLSGNAQKRKRTSILHHGTILHDFDVNCIGNLLPMPPSEPEYRARRSHSEFVMNLDLTRAEIVDRISSAWATDGEWEESVPGLADLVRDKYTNDEWTFRF